MRPKITPFSPEFLRGIWQIARQIDDRRAGHMAHMAGQAEFTPDDDGLICRERGRLNMPGGHSFEAERCYLWRFGPHGLVRVLFEDGRLFHEFDPQEPSTEQVHYCGDDIYRGSYSVQGQAWQSCWKVQGPRKDQVIVTEFVKAVT